MPRLVSFHICKASRRSSKFRQPVADLCLSPFFLPRPPSTTLRSSLLRSLLSSSFLRPVQSLIGIAVLLPCAHLRAFCLPIYEPPKIDRKGAGKIGDQSDLRLWYLLFRFIFSFSSSSYIFSVCACDERRFSLVKERERERDHLFSECLTATSLITSGLDSCGYGQESPGETRDLRRRAWEASLEFQSSAFSWSSPWVLSLLLLFQYNSLYYDNVKCYKKS